MEHRVRGASANSRPKEESPAGAAEIPEIRGDQISYDAMGQTVYFLRVFRDPLSLGLPFPDGSSSFKYRAGGGKPKRASVADVIS